MTARTIRGRLLLGFGLTILSLFGAGLVGVHALLTVNREIQKSTRELAMVGNTLFRLHDATLREVALAEAELLGGGSSALQMSDLSSEADSLRRTLRSVDALTTAERATLERMGTLHSTIEVYLSVARAYSDLGNLAGAQQQVRLATGWLDSLFVETTTLGAAQEARTASTLAAMRDVVRSRQIVLLAILTLGLLVALWFGRITWRAVTRPLDRMTGAAQRLGEGHLDVHIDSEGFDAEYSVLAQAFGDMVDRLRTLVSDLKLASVAADTANQTKSDFLANMSHELRTPLNAIIGYSEMLIDDADESTTGEFVPDLKKIQSSGRHLLGLINDILDLSKVESGRMDVYLETFDLAALLNEVASTVRPLMEKNRNNVEVSVSPDLGEVMSDQVKVRQILLNLLSNASKFTEEGKITLSGERTGDEVVLRVRDTGIGMTGEQVGKLFQPFMQADAATSSKYGGTGLGLVISKQFCELLGGSVVVESDIGQGTMFIVRLPAGIRELQSAS
ncbi:MAG: HAMP domain-containing sensor histidine kinase [Longimicrobiales bacterium]